MKRIIFQLGIVLGVFFVMPVFSNVFGASLQFDPTTVTAGVGQTFEVKVNVNAGTEEIAGVDAWITYDKATLEAQSVNNGTFFPTVSSILTTPGKVYLAGLLDDPSTSKTGTGTLATVVFKAKSNGTATLAFNCGQGSATDSHISKNDINATDIIQCSSNGSSSVTSGSGTSSANTPTPTPTTSSGTSGGTAATPTSISQLPQSGIIENNLPLFAVAGTFLFLIGIGFKLLL